MRCLIVAYLPSKARGQVRRSDIWELLLFELVPTMSDCLRWASQTELAQRIGVSRLSVSELVHEKRAMSPEMAVRIATLLSTSPESWLRMQEAVDLWTVRQDAGKLATIVPLSQSRLDLAA